VGECKKRRREKEGDSLCRRLVMGYSRSDALSGGSVSNVVSWGKEGSKEAEVLGT